MKLNQRKIEGQKRYWQNTVINKTNLQVSSGDPISGPWLGLGKCLVLSGVISGGLPHSHRIPPELTPGSTGFLPSLKKYSLMVVVVRRWRGVLKRRFLEAATKTLRNKK